MSTLRVSKINFPTYRPFVVHEYFSVDIWNPILPYIIFGTRCIRLHCEDRVRYLILDTRFRCSRSSHITTIITHTIYVCMRAIRDRIQLIYTLHLSPGNKTILLCAIIWKTFIKNGNGYLLLFVIYCVVYIESEVLGL